MAPQPTTSLDAYVDVERGLDRAFAEKIRDVAYAIAQQQLGPRYLLTADQQLTFDVHTCELQDSLDYIAKEAQRNLPDAVPQTAYEEQAVRELAGLRNQLRLAHQRIDETCSNLLHEVLILSKYDEVLATLVLRWEREYKPNPADGLIRRAERAATLQCLIDLTKAIAEVESYHP